jgi:hypothetical protein
LVAAVFAARNDGGELGGGVQWAGHLRCSQVSRVAVGMDCRAALAMTGVGRVMLQAPCA